MGIAIANRKNCCDLGALRKYSFSLERTKKKTNVHSPSHEQTFSLEQETILRLSGPCPEGLLAPSLIDFLGNPGIRALCQAIGIST